MIVGSYLVYLTISISVTVWVGRTLHHNGRLFLVDSFLGNEALADSVNHLLVVGFYLLNFGFVSVALRYGSKPLTLEEAVVYLSSKIGLVLLVLGVVHLFNIRTFSSMRRRAMDGAERTAARQMAQQAV
jgi:hypothetical protein